MTELSFFVAGEPVPQGSMIPVTRPGYDYTLVVPDNAAELARWRDKVGQVAGLARPRDWPDRCSSAVHLTCRFLLPMPPSRAANDRKRGIALCGVKPDLDKLLRAIGDALTTAQLLFDDSRIVKGGQVKYEVADHRLCGAEILVRIIDVATEHQSMMDVLERRRAHITLPLRR